MIELKLVGSNNFCLIDDEDFERVSVCSWYLGTSGKYVVGRPGGKNTKLIYLHRFLMNHPRSKIIDHKDGNKLNNQISNLRFCSIAQNGANSKKRKKTTSKFKGVSWNGPRNKWRAVIGFKNKYIYLGRFEKEIDAAKAYDNAAKKHFKEFARPNFATA